MAEELINELVALAQRLEAEKNMLHPMILQAPDDQIPALFQQYSEIGTKIAAINVQVGVLKVASLKSSHDPSALRQLAAKAQAHAADIASQAAKYTDATERARYLAGCVDSGLAMLKNLASKV